MPRERYSAGLTKAAKRHHDENDQRKRGGGVTARASEERYRRLFESSKDGILILDAETGRVVDANPFITQLLGYSLEVCLGKYIWDPGFLKNVAANKERFLELRSSHSRTMLHMRDVLADLRPPAQGILHISPKTVDTCRSRLMQKTQPPGTSPAWSNSRFSTA